MTLSTRLRGVDLVLKCKYCDHPKIKKGTWFMIAHHFECEGCKHDVPVTYSDKVALFAEHAHLEKDEGYESAAREPDQIATLPPQDAPRPTREPKAR